MHVHGDMYVFVCVHVHMVHMCICTSVFIHKNEYQMHATVAVLSFCSLYISMCVKLNYILDIG